MVLGNTFVTGYFCLAGVLLLFRFGLKCVPDTGLGLAAECSSSRCLQLPHARSGAQLSTEELESVCGQMKPRLQHMLPHGCVASRTELKSLLLHRTGLHAHLSLPHP